MCARVNVLSITQVYSAFMLESKVSPSQSVLFQGPNGGEEEGDGSKPVDIRAASGGFVPARRPAHFSGIAFIGFPAEPDTASAPCVQDVFLALCASGCIVSLVSEVTAMLTYKIACKAAALAVPASQGNKQQSWRGCQPHSSLALKLQETLQGCAVIAGRGRTEPLID